MSRKGVQGGDYLLTAWPYSIFAPEIFIAFA